MNDLTIVEQILNTPSDQCYSPAEANSCVATALVVGSLIKPAECENCGAEDLIYPLEAHHNNYAEPLDVEWLCRSCHNAIPKLNNQTVYNGRY